MESFEIIARDEQLLKWSHVDSAAGSPLVGRVNSYGVFTPLQWAAALVKCKTCSIDSQPLQNKIKFQNDTLSVCPDLFRSSPDPGVSDVPDGGIKMRSI